MGRHALAYVKWPVLRSGPSGRPAFRANFYRSKTRSVYKLDGGGTLWVVTGLRNSEGQQVYTLAYKLAGCMAVPGDQMGAIPFPHLGDHAVIATDAEGTFHFSFKHTTATDFTSKLLDLRFTDKKPIPDSGKIGWWLRGFPNPDGDSAELLRWMERKLRYGRRVLISYAREDQALVARLQQGLEDRGLTVWRDLTALRAGENWRSAVQDNLAVADAFLVLLSKASLGSSPVRDEIEWATESLNRPEGIRGVVPLLAPGMPRRQVPAALRDLTSRRVSIQPNPAFLDKLALEIAKLTGS